MLPQRTAPAVVIIITRCARCCTDRRAKIARGPGHHRGRALSQEAPDELVALERALLEEQPLPLERFGTVVNPRLD
jgi:hypothetical protein